MTYLPWIPVFLISRYLGKYINGNAHAVCSGEAKSDNINRGPNNAKNNGATATKTIQKHYQQLD